MSKQTDHRLQDEFELSNRQEMRLSNQLSRAINASGINQIGQSRFELKSKFSDECKGSHELNGKIGITSYASMGKFQTNTKMFARFCFDSGVNNLNQIKPDHVVAFLNKLIDNEYAKNSIQSYASSIEKFAIVLDRIDPLANRSESWHEAVSSCRERIGEEAIVKDGETRAYENPHAVVDAISDPVLHFCAHIALDYGLRIGDATKIKFDQLEGSVILVDNSKNGQNLHVTLRESDIAQMRGLVAEYGTLCVKQDVYNAALKQAALDCGENWTGSHAFRHNFAQIRMDTLVKSGCDYYTAKCIVSAEMGHHRPEIIDVYLR